MSVFQMGPNTLAVPMSMFKNNRNRVANEVRKNNQIIAQSSYILLQGGKDISFYDTDVNYLFRQESYFQYMFGVKEPGCYGVVRIEDGYSVLFVPKYPEEYATWMGPLLTTDDFKNMYEVDETRYVNDIDEYFEDIDPCLILTLATQNTDSGLHLSPATFKGIEKYNVDSNILYPILAECRVIKSLEEIEVLRYVAKISSDAHKKVMRTIKPGMSEYQAESIFLHHCYSIGGCRHVSYTCICGSGMNGAILHYGHAASPNDKIIKDGEMCLFDMGANYCGYAADITCSFPVNGKFTEDQKLIYNSVLAARDAVIASVKPGVSWVDMHFLALCAMFEKMKNGGILKGDIEEMIQAGLGAIFQPHGLGHLIGLDVHDVGGYLEGQPKRPEEPGFNKLRFARILKAGMYVTVEPGCYFIEHLREKVLADSNLRKFINEKVFNRFRDFGGVRIEENILITENGCELFSVVPRTIEEIESFMATEETRNSFTPN